MNKIFLLLLLFCAGFTAFGQSKSYYVSLDGNDNNSGLSVKQAWKSLDRVNMAEFQPGDNILFERGGTWSGRLQPKGNGAPGKPVTLTSYGKGSRPVINMGKAEGAAIYLVNQSWWKIEGFEVTSGAPPELKIFRAGIYATALGEGTAISNIIVRDCYVHDIWGQTAGSRTGFGIYVGPRVASGVDDCKDCIGNDILVENNIIRRVDKIGIVTNGKENVIIRGNKLENIGGDGIIAINANKGLIEYNIADRTCLRTGDPDIYTGGEKWWTATAAIWIWKCKETVMQFNEVYNTGRQKHNGDGMAYDFDYECERCILQYNYSAYNRGGFMLVMDKTKDNFIRYNISQNDQTHLIYVHGYTKDNNVFHNNVFYVDNSTVDIDYHLGRPGTKDSTGLGAIYRNNIFYAGAQGRFRTVYSTYKMEGGAVVGVYYDTLYFKPEDGGALFENNCYYGPWKNGLPEDKNGVFADPLFIEPGSGGIGLQTLTGYKLRDGSPCINSGVSIGSGSGRDFYGVPILDNIVDIGAAEKEAPGKAKP